MKAGCVHAWLTKRVVHLRHSFRPLCPSVVAPVGTYMLTKLLLDSLLLRVLPTAAFSIPIYWLMGWRPTAAAFFTFTGVLCTFAGLAGGHNLSLCCVLLLHDDSMYWLLRGATAPVCLTSCYVLLGKAVFYGAAASEQLPPSDEVSLSLFCLLASQAQHAWGCQCCYPPLAKLC